MTGPTVVRTRAELDAVLPPRHPHRVALVPTMGALHDGHRSLMRTAADVADIVAVSIFVNPLQFGPGEDLARYPRTFDADLDVCRDEKVDIVFAPETSEVYDGGLEQRVAVRASGVLADRLEGKHRPGHFDGVLTVVLKLFNMVRPDVAVFGEKDAQQLALVRRMVGDLDVPVEVVGSPTIREDGGLALSSRNVYLSAEDRAAATVLSRALRLGADASDGGPSAVREAATAELATRPEVSVDYLALVDPLSFEDVPGSGPGATGPALLLVAARVGGTRLIDNVRLELS